MQRRNDESPFSLSQRAYLIADTFRQSTKTLLIFYGALVFYILIGLYSFFYEDDPTALVAVIFIFFIIATPFLLWYLIKIFSFSRLLKQFNMENLQNTYILIFDTTLPKGNTTGEIILGLANMIFPELREDYLKFSVDFIDHIRYYFRRKFGKPKGEIISQSLGYKIGSEYSLELALKTPEGYFIVKEFRDKAVSVEDLKDLVKILQRKFKTKFLRRTNIFRVICVAKEFDESLLNRQSLERIMEDELEAPFDIDLILQEDIGYSVLWIS